MKYLMWNKLDTNSQESGNALHAYSWVSESSYHPEYSEVSSLMQ